MVPSSRNVEITAMPCSFAPSWAASSRVVMCLPFVPCLRLKGSSFWLTIRKGHDLIAVLTTGSLRSYCPVSDRLPRTTSRTPAFLEYAYMALGDEFLTVWGYPLPGWQPSTSDQTSAARSDASSACGASTMAGPYQVRNRPLTSAHGMPGNASGPSALLNWYGSSGNTTRSTSGSCPSASFG